MTKFKLYVALITGLILSFPVAAKLYKWVDDNGITHYGETIPPEYAGKDREELNKDGRVIKSEEVMTPERRHAKELEDEKKREEAQVALEQQRHDKTLINTYSNVHEIDLARNRSVQQLDARINMLNSYLKAANENLIALQKEADGYTKANKQIPGSLQDDMNNAQDRIVKLQQDLEKPNARKADLEARFKADRARYIELTGGK
jgi:chromosome segregation ATPase